MKIKRVKVKDGLDKYTFYCLGCDEHHCINESWSFNGDYDKPTISPSIAVQGVGTTGSKKKCHSFIVGGKIEYLSDCTHRLKGQTVDLPNIN